MFFLFRNEQKSSRQKRVIRVIHLRLNRIYPEGTTNGGTEGDVKLQKGVGFHVSGLLGVGFCRVVGQWVFFFLIHVFVVVRSGLLGGFLLIIHHLFFGRRLEKIVEDCRFGLPI